MTIEEIRAMAEKANREGEKELAVILFTYLGSRYQGTQGELCDYVSNFARAAIDGINYQEWLNKS